MEKLINDIERIEFITGDNFRYDLDKEFDLISSYLNREEQKLLKEDFDRYFQKGRFLVFNTFSGGILFLKESELMEKINIEVKSDSIIVLASVVYASELRNAENTKYKPQAGRTESTEWNIESIFPNFPRYKKTIQHALLIVIGKIVKRICEYGQNNFAYLKIGNEFNIELQIDGEVVSILKVELN